METLNFVGKLWNCPKSPECYHHWMVNVYIVRWQNDGFSSPLFVTGWSQIPIQWCSTRLYPSFSRSLLRIQSYNLYNLPITGFNIIPTVVWNYSLHNIFDFECTFQARKCFMISSLNPAWEYSQLNLVPLVPPPTAQKLHQYCTNDLALNRVLLCKLLLEFLSFAHHHYRMPFVSQFP